LQYSLIDLAGMRLAGRQRKIKTHDLCSGSHVLSSNGYMYSGTMTVDLGGIPYIAELGLDAFGVRPGDTPGVEGLGFLFCRIRSISLKRPMM
jgi:hypothetical protein